MNIAANFYVNDSLSSNSKTMAFNCRKLKKQGLITDTWCANGKIKILTLDGNTKIISHEFDLFNLFRDFDFSFDTSRYINITSDDTELEKYDDLDGW